MLNSSFPTTEAASEDGAIDAIVRAGPSGALVLAGIATAIVIALWFAFYLLVFVPRASPRDRRGPMTAQDHYGSAAVAARVERRWAVISVGAIVLIAAVAAYAGLHQGAMPQSRVETADPTRLHIAGEFIESNLGTAQEPDGSVTVRAIGQQYSFTPACLVVPADTPVTLRATSADVVHGLLIEGTNVNTMLVPGYVSVLPVRFDKPGEHLMPCQEFCSVGHEGMWAKVRVVDKQAFRALSADRRRVSCVE